jgi:membrane protease YdiL (CAAX protease family)
MQGADLAVSRAVVIGGARAESVLVLAFATAIVVGEAVAVTAGVEAALIYEAALLALMSVRAAFGSLSRPALRATYVLAVVPLTRIASIALPQRVVPGVYWDLLPAAVALFAVVGIRLVASERFVPWFPRTLRRSLVQLAVVAAAVPLAIAAIVHSLPSPLGQHVTRHYVTVLSVAAFGGIALELLFRGAIQPALQRLFGWSGVAATTILYAGFFIGTGSAWLVLAALVSGAIWGAVAARTRLLAGVALSHALFAMIWAAAWFAEFHP